MEILKPRIVQFGTFRYRLNPGDDQPSSLLSYDDLEAGDESHDHADRSDEVDDRVKESGRGTYSATLDIPSALFKFIVGKKGETKRRLEYETQCKVLLPARGEEGAVLIKGSNANQVSSAIARIEVLTESGRTKQQFTHFISVPVNQEVVQESFHRFQEQVMQLNSPGVDKSIFQNPSKLHLTIGTLTLLNDAEVNRACKLLHECQPSIHKIMGPGCRVEVTDLDYMNDDPSAVDVLYAKVKSADDSDRLQEAVDTLSSAFNSARLFNNDFDRKSVKLHLTLMNTLFRKDTTGAGNSSDTNRRSKDRVTFEAGRILKEMSEFSFGEVDFTGFHLSKRYSTDCQGYYEPVTIIHPADGSGVMET